MIGRWNNFSVQEIKEIPKDVQIDHVHRKHPKGSISSPFFFISCFCY